MRNKLFGLGIILRVTAINLVVIIATLSGIYYVAFHVFLRFDLSEELINLAKMGDVQKNIFNDGIETTEIDFHYYWQVFKGAFFFFAIIGLMISGLVNVVGTYYLQKQIRQCIKFTEELALGNTKATLNINQADELGVLANLLRQVAQNLYYTTQFASEIGKGNTDIELHHATNSQNPVVFALKEIQQKLVEAKRLEQEENYIITGITTISELIRQSNNDLDEICHLLLKEILHYTKGYAGSLYTTEAEELEMKAHYALSPEIVKKRKYLMKGEGLVGQVAKTQKSIVINPIPPDYIKIQSLSGESEKLYLAILPIVANYDVVGVIELAYFSPLPNYQIQYLEKSAQIIGTTILSIKSAIRTQELLEETQKTAQQLQISQNELRHQYEALNQSQQEISKQKRLLEDQNLKIVHSIRYAQQIQKAILPTSAQRLSILPNSFVIYKPKDIVSGDFFWISQHTDKILVGVIDCTGHGVPGAFMSLIGHSIISDAIYSQNTYNPAEILNYLHIEVRKKLNQEQGANNDGMDVGLCLIQPTDNQTYTIKITYAGAKHKLFYTQDHQVQMLVSDKYMIGGKDTEKERSYNNQFLELAKGEMIYMTTDGFIDQANPQRKSFNINRLTNLIQQVHLEDTDRQKELFDTALTEYQQEADQRDDITLLAFRV